MGRRVFHFKILRCAARRVSGERRQVVRIVSSGRQSDNLRSPSLCFLFAPFFFSNSFVGSFLFSRAREGGVCEIGRGEVRIVLDAVPESTKRSEVPTAMWEGYLHKRSHLGCEICLPDSVVFAGQMLALLKRKMSKFSSFPFSCSLTPLQFNCC